MVSKTNTPPIVIAAMPALMPIKATMVRTTAAAANETAKIIDIIVSP
jgi:hypothetical protein